MDILGPFINNIMEYMMMGLRSFWFAWDFLTLLWSSRKETLGSNETGTISTKQYPNMVI